MTGKDGERSVTALSVSRATGLTELVRSLPTAVRAVLPVRAAGDRMAASGASARLLARQALLELAPQPSNRSLTLAQLVHHPGFGLHIAHRLQGDVEGADRQGHIHEPLLRGTPGHITTIAVSESRLWPPLETCSAKPTAVGSRGA